MFDVIDTLSNITIYSGTLEQCENESCKRGGEKCGYVICQQIAKIEPVKKLVITQQVKKEPEEGCLF